MLPASDPTSHQPQRIVAMNLYVPCTPYVQQSDIIARLSLASTNFSSYLLLNSLTRLIATASHVVSQRRPIPSPGGILTVKLQFESVHSSDVFSITIRLLLPLISSLACCFWPLPAPNRACSPDPLSQASLGTHEFLRSLHTT